MNPWLDSLLILLSPVFIVPTILLLGSPIVGIEGESMSMVVVAFGALGHHFPGMMRAYCDRDLFRRFRLRFILAPLLIFVAFFPLFHYQPSAIKLILGVWACWHALMQVYGFVRIYDVKVGSNAWTTVHLDWMICLCWFVTAQIYSPGKMSALLTSLYDVGIPFLPPHAIQMIRVACIAIALLITIAFVFNHVVRTVRGPRPNQLKLLLLANGIGVWWFAAVSVQNLLVGVAIFEIYHDLQYLTIVWLFNRRRAQTNPQVGVLLTSLFRRGMLPVYLGLVFGYGAMGLIPRLAQGEMIKTIFGSILWTSTILHYYYDGFIWKIRETATRESLGMSGGQFIPHPRRFAWIGGRHLLIWSPFALGVTCLLLMSDPHLTGAQKDDLRQKYANQILRSATIPSGSSERSWIARIFTETINIADTIPDDPRMQCRAATVLANFGKKDAAVLRLRESLERNRNSSQNSTSHLTLGEIYHQQGQIEDALVCYESALHCANTRDERKFANHRLGELLLDRKQYELAKAKFEQALRDDPGFKASQLALQQIVPLIP